ncbi:putative leader peptide [Streptomyces sp. NPDC020597]
MSRATPGSAPASTTCRTHGRVSLHSRRHIDLQRVAAALCLS